MTGPSSKRRIRVYGAPQPQGNKTGFVRGGKVIMTEGRRPKARKEFASWREGIRSAASDWVDEHDAPPLDEPVTVTCLFVMPKPASKPKWRWLPDTRPDVDKLARAVLDGIGGVLIASDARVVGLAAVKVFDPRVAPGCEITVAPCGEAERAGTPIEVALEVGSFHGPAEATA